MEYHRPGAHRLHLQSCPFFSRAVSVLYKMKPIHLDYLEPLALIRYIQQGNATWGNRNPTQYSLHGPSGVGRIPFCIGRLWQGNAATFSAIIAYDDFHNGNPAV